MKARIKNHEYQKRRLKIREKRLGPPDLEIRKICGVGIQACDAKDTLKIRNVIHKLKGLVNDRYKAVACGFYRQYDYCLQFVNDKEFDKARNILYELHQSWNMVTMMNVNDT